MDTAPVNHIEIINGKAMIRRRYKAKIIASMIVNAKSSIEWVMEEFDLTRAEVHAALAYYYDNQEVIEQEFREAEAYAHEHGISADELIEQLEARQQGK